MARSTNGSEPDRSRFLATEPTGAPIRQLKTAELVARQVVEDIMSDGLETGDTLVGEAAMLEHYGVSRESLREALRLLEVQGLITIRRGPGGGPSVGTVDPAHLGRNLTLFYKMAGVSYRDLFEAWVACEAQVAERAARHDDVERRRAAMAPYVGGVEPDDATDLAGFVATHSHFHFTVAQLSDNRILALNTLALGAIITHHFVTTDDPRTIGHLADDHADIASAISAGYQRKTRDLMKHHIERIVDIHIGRGVVDPESTVEWR